MAAMFYGDNIDNRCGTTRNPKLPKKKLLKKAVRKKTG
jgi:hypothetical protein